MTDRTELSGAAWVRAGVLASVGVLLGVAALLAARRLAGALTAPLPAGPLLATAALAGAIVLGGRAAWRRILVESPTAKQRAQTRLLAWTGTLALWLLAVGCSHPATRLVDWVAWLPLLMADQVLRQGFLGGREERAKPQAVGGGDVVQQLCRTRGADGGESIQGTLRAEFAAGQRHAALHVGFCPPLARLPQVDAEPGDGPDASVRVVQAFAHGARLEVRLADPAEEACTVLVEFSATPAL